jgi:hypothetical protein
MFIVRPGGDTQRHCPGELLSYRAIKHALHIITTAAFIVGVGLRLSARAFLVRSFVGVGCVGAIMLDLHSNPDRIIQCLTLSSLAFLSGVHYSKLLSEAVVVRPISVPPPGKFFYVSE